MADIVELKTAAPPAPLDPSKVPAAAVSADGNRVSIDSTVKPAVTPEPDKAPAADPSRPEWLPAEFKSPEEFAAAWKTSKTPPAPQVPAVKDAESVVTKAGLDMAALQSEFTTTGQLSPESFAKLEKAGVTKTQVGEYIEGQKAKAQLYNQTLETTVGGKEELQATLQWAASNLTPAEVAVANKALQSMDPDQAKVVLSGLHSRRLMESGVEPKLVGGRAMVAAGVQGYESTAQWMKDVRSPEYKSDPAFRAKVMKRLQVSTTAK